MLRPCQACRRHVKSTSCPFCGAAQPASLGAPAVRGVRRHRGQLLAGAAVLGAITLAACSDVVDLAIEKGPQTVTRHGHEVVVIASKADFERRRRSSGPPETALSFLRGLAFVGARLSLERSRDLDHDIEL